MAMYREFYGFTGMPFQSTHDPASAESLGVDEVERYLHQCLTSAGWNGNPTFAPRVFVDIHAATGGLTNRIDHLADLLLAHAAARQQQHIDDVMLALVLAALPDKTDSGVVESWPREPLADRLPAGQGAGQTPDARLQIALARCEAQIAALQRTVGAIVDAADGHTRHADRACVQDRLGSLESRVMEQDRTIRHTLTMLIDWIEHGQEHNVAA